MTTPPSIMCAFTGVGDDDISAIMIVKVFDFRVELLSDREKRVFIELGRGQGVKATARAIGVSASTVHSFASNIREKMDIDSMDRLISYGAIYGDAVTRFQRLPQRPLE